MKKLVGEEITINANEFLGTEEANATVVQVDEKCYWVNIEGDDPEWVGPVDFDGNIIVDPRAMKL